VFFVCVILIEGLNEIYLVIITIFTGVKGAIARENISSVLSFFSLEENVTYIDIREKMQDSKVVLDAVGSAISSRELYLELYERGILPCGKICNLMIDMEYQEAMNRMGYQVLITGGDTPKKNKEGDYFLFWTKKSGITILCGAYAFDLSKDINKYNKGQKL